MSLPINIPPRIPTRGNYAITAQWANGVRESIARLANRKFPQQRGGGGGSSDYVPWQPQFFTEGTEPSITYKCRFNLGTCNNVVATNWNDAFTLPSDDSSEFVVLTVTTASGKVTGITLSVDATAPAEDVIAEDTPPVTHKIVLGAIGKTTAKMIVTHNIVILAEEVFRSTDAAPAAGAEPFNRWWRWSVQPV